ncbi:MAG: alpha/beta hydrolase-fold protein [Oscillospiraceae bacterium]
MKTKNKGIKILKIILIVLLTLVVAFSIFIYFFLGKAGRINIFSSIDMSSKMQGEVLNASNGVTLPYNIYVPQGYDESKEYPLVLFMHGSGERGTDNVKQATKNSIMQTLLSEENLQKYPCIVIAPQCPEDKRWSVMIGAEQPAFDKAREEPLIEAVNELVSTVAQSYSVDENRMYATGISMGAGGLYSLLMHNPDTFAAAVITCGYAPVNGAEILKDLPMKIYHGDADSITPVDYSRDFVNALEAAGADKYEYIEYPNENHTVWELAFREADLYPWLFAQAK